MINNEKIIDLYNRLLLNYDEKTKNQLSIEILKHFIKEVEKIQNIKSKKEKQKANENLSKLIVQFIEVDSETGEEDIIIDNEVYELLSSVGYFLEDNIFPEIVEKANSLIRKF